MTVLDRLNDTTNELQRQLLRHQDILKNHRDALELARQGAGLEIILNLLFAGFDRVSSPHIKASSIHLVDGDHLSLYSGPSLPVELYQALKDIDITGEALPLNLSARDGEVRETPDIRKDEGCRSIVDAALKQEISRLHCSPIFSSEGLVLAVVTVYGDQEMSLTAEYSGYLELIVGTAALMIERHKGSEDRVRFVAELERSRQQMSEVFAQAPVAICVTEGPEHIYSFVNNNFFDKYGEYCKDIYGRSVKEVFPGSIDDGFVDILNHVYESGEPYVGREVPSRAARDAQGFNGKTYVNFIYQPKRNAQGVVDGIICVFTDVTEQVQSRKLLEKAKLQVENERENFQNLFAQTPEIVCILRGPNHIFEFVNDAHIKILGKDPTGQTFKAAQPESVEVHSILDKVFQTGVTAELREIEMTVGDRVRVFNLTYAARMDTDGIIDGVMILGTEVTEQLAIRREIENSRQWLENILNRLPSPLFLLDPVSGRIIFANESADRLIGFSSTNTMPATIVEQHKVEIYDRYGDQLSPDDTPSARALRGEVMKNEEFYILGPGGRYHVTAYSETLRHMDDRPSTTLLLLQDVSPIKAAQAAAEAANLAKSAFLANMSHEIRTPLGAIMGFLELMKNPNCSREDINSYIQVIDRNSDQLLRLIDDILDLSKVEAGKMFFERIEFSLRELLSDFSKMMRFKAQEKGIQYELKLTSKVPERVLSDPLRIRQILTNVVGNAIKFTEQGEVVVDVSFTEDELRFVVADTGRGISIEQSQKLFRPFAQADSSTTRAYGGTGLGLVLTRRLANAMGGDFILQRSELGVGSVFFASVRVDVPSDSELMERGPLHAVSRARPKVLQEQILRGTTILVVEDSVDNQALLNILLSNLGASIDIACDGKEGVKMAKNKKYDLILMDVQMPVMDGHKATRCLRDGIYDGPIIALTAHAMKEERDRCEESGFSDFLTKPIQHGDLVQMLQKYRPAVETDLESSST